MCHQAHVWPATICNDCNNVVNERDSHWLHHCRGLVICLICGLILPLGSMYSTVGSMHVGSVCPRAACSASCHFLSLPLLCFHSLSLFLLPLPLPVLTLSLVTLLFLVLYPGLRFILPLRLQNTVQLKKREEKERKNPNNSLQYLPLAICCPRLSQLAPYLRRPPPTPCRRVCFNLTKGAGRKKKWRKKRSRHHRNIQPYQRDLLRAET